MALSYFNLSKKSKKGKEEAQESPTETPKSPVLDEEDEKFLERLASLSAEPEATPPPLPERPVVILDGGKKVEGRDAQEVLMDGAEKVPLPMSPPEIEGDSKKKKENRKSLMDYWSAVQDKVSGGKEKAKEKEEKHKDKKKEKKEQKEKDKHADKGKEPEAAQASVEKEAEKEGEDLTAILDQLNLSAVNNRVFSFSKESQELLDKFKLVLKDIVNGVPTAYNDLEKLLTDSEGQLKKMYGNLPPFLQNLVKSLPAKMSAGLVPEILAASAEKPGFDAKMKAQAADVGGAGASSKKKKSKRSKIPSLKSLLSVEGGVATMLRSILNFLKLRFPAFVTGTNVLMSLAVFLLLFVFWYCHKRGRETRLEKERLDADSAMTSSVSSLEESAAEETFEKKAEEKILSDTQATREGAKAGEPPLIIGDSKEIGDKPSAVVSDMPDVLHLPDPSEGIAPLKNDSAGKTPLSPSPVRAQEKK